MEAAQLRLSLQLSKCHIVGNHTWRLNYVRVLKRSMTELAHKSLRIEAYVYEEV